MQLVFIYAANTGLYSQYPFLVISDFLYWTFLGPLLFLFIQAVSQPERRLKRIDLLHLLPFVIVIATHFDFIINHMMSTNLVIYTHSNRDNIFLVFGAIVFALTNPAYYILTILSIRKHRRAVPDFFSYKTTVDLRWIYYLTHGFAIYLILEVFIILAGDHLNLEFLNSVYRFSWIVLNIYIFGIGLVGYKQKSIFFDYKFDPYPNEKNLSYEEKDVIEYSTEKYKRSGLTEEEKSYILNKLHDYMTQEKPYLACDLNLKTLAESINTSPHKLSQVLNESLSKNFFEYINEYRIEEIKKKLSDAEQMKYNITALAYDSGFNSVSAFYNIFKKYTKQTPVQYRNQSLKLT